MRLKIRNPKSEIRRKSEIRNPKRLPGRAAETNSAASGGNSVFRISDFGFPSDFEFRISDFARLALAASLLTAAASAPAAAPPFEITIASRSAPLREFSPDDTFGGTFDGHSQDEIAPFFSPANMQAMKGAGLRSVSYRLRTELAVQNWHWNDCGTFSEPGGRQGYWISDPTPGPRLGVTHGFRLPRRGSSSDQADDDGFSRLLDGNPATFWKSNPYLDNHFTGEPNDRHPQWIIVRLERVSELDALEINWGTPHATRISLQTSLSEKDFDYLKPSDWQPLEIALEPPRGGRQLIRFGRSVRALQFRILMHESSGRAATADPGDVRDQLGYAVEEIQLGRLRSDGTLDDLLRHSRVGYRQSRIAVSSTDPWHRATDRDPNAEQAGFDLIYQSELVARRPMLLSFGLLYDTPENAANALRYLRARGYPISGIELGEEPDGQFTEPADYGALYLQFHDALRRVDPDVLIGGPSFQTEYEERKPFRTQADPESWYARFLAYLRERQREAAYQFFSFEWYPFDSVCDPAAPQILQSTDRLRGILNEWKLDGLSERIPWMITEYHYSRFGAEAEMDLAGAIVCAEVGPLFLTLGGSRAYFQQLEPGTMVREPWCNRWGNQLMLLADENGGRPPAKLAAYWALQLVATRWVEPGTNLHALHPVHVTAPPDSSAAKLSAFAVRRPAGDWGLLLLSKDPEKPLTVKLFFDAHSADAPRREAHATLLDQFSREQYEWKADGENGRPVRSLPPRRTPVSGSEILLPPFSISVVTIAPAGTAEK